MPLPDQWGHEENRMVDNLAQHYQAWLGAARAKGQGNLQWKGPSRKYLYRTTPAGSHVIGPVDETTQALFQEHRQARQTLTAISMPLAVDANLYRTLRLPRISPYAADILRELDIAGWLDGGVLVVGTTAVCAYEIEAGCRFAQGWDATEDFDMTWKGERQTPAEGSLLDTIKRVDPTYTVNMERSFQVRNAKGYEVELLLAKSKQDEFPATEKFSPIPLPEQDALLLGRPVSAVVVGTNQKPARIVAPDPRFFGLHKLWLSEKTSRKPSKKQKDQAQGALVLEAVRAYMPHYPFDDAFKASLPQSLLPVLARWQSQAGPASPRSLRPR